ncbi:hypothetical protein CA606_18530 [Caulobacter vibrioides]|uniref:Phage tail protein n=1 Tax=Caulobacter vibrioides TaxID=155892 RepID=A0A290MPZ9_CAUVI|nr:hypothetical protein [Caulobacter vibrioides]ATC34167.1 hypothetical protein CA606_18530 [Caulobacter vibrioides]
MTATILQSQSRGRAVQTRLAFEATAGVLATSGWKPVRFYTLTAGMDRPLVKDDQLGLAMNNARDATKRRKGLPGGSLRRTTPINLTEAGYWLSAAMARAAPTGANGDYVHAFTSGGNPTQTLSLSHLWETGDVSTDIGAAVAELSISAAKTDQAARFNMTMVGLGEVEGEAWPAGTVAAAAAADDFSDWRWRVLWNDVAIGTALNIDVNLNLGVERVNGLDGDEWPSFHHFGEIDPSGSFRLYGQGKAFRDFADTDDVGVLTLEATHPDDEENRFFRIATAGVQVSKPQREVSGGGQTSASFNFGASQDADTPAVTIELGNGVASY